MSDEISPERRQPPPRLTIAQQDRAAGLLVGMAVGEWIMSPGRDDGAHRRHAGEITDRALLAVEEDQPEPFDHMEWPGSWDPYLLLALSSTSGYVLRNLHREPEEFFSSTYDIGVSDAEEMTFGDARALGEACALWAVMLQHAVLTGEADLRVGLSFIKGNSYQWSQRIRDMEHGFEASLDGGRPGALLMSAWATVSTTDAVNRSQRFTTLMQHASRRKKWPAGPLAGAALGAIHGFSAIPWSWRRFLRDVRGNSADHLMRAGVSATLGLDGFTNSWPGFQRITPGQSASPLTIGHPADPGVLLGGIGALEETRIDAVVSLCHPGVELRAQGVLPPDHAVFWLADSDDPQDNPNRDFALKDAARTVQALRKEGKTVLLHGLTGESRTPAVAAQYGALISGRSVWAEFQRVARVLPQTAPNAGFLQYLASADACPAEVAEVHPAEQSPFGHLTVDRQLIELLSWTIAAELLKKDHADGWVEPMDGPGDGFVVLLGGTRIEFLRAGAGITLDGEPFLSWSQIVTAGGPHLVVARLEAELGLLFRGCVVIQTTTSSWKAEFAAALVRSGYGSTRTVRVQPLAEAEEKRGYIHERYGPRLLCTVDDFSFVVDQTDVIATGMAPLWTAGSGDEGPELAACTVLNRLLEWRRDRDE